VLGGTGSYAVNVGIGNTAPGELLSLGLAGTTKGVLSLAGNTSGKVMVQPAAAAGSWNLTLPTSGGTNGYRLQTDGSGVCSWAPPYGRNVVTVAPSGAEYTTIQGAIDAINLLGTASSSNPFVVAILPGDYNEQITCYDFIHLLGVGQTQYGPVSVRIHHSDWIIRTAQCNISNIRFELDTGGAAGTKQIVDGEFTSSTGRTIFFNTTTLTVYQNI